LAILLRWLCNIKHVIRTISPGTKLFLVDYRHDEWILLSYIEAVGADLLVHALSSVDVSPLGSRWAYTALFKSPPFTLANHGVLIVSAIINFVLVHVPVGAVLIGFNLLDLSNWTFFPVFSHLLNVLRVPQICNQAVM